MEIISAAVPLLSNAGKVVSGLKEKKIEAEMANSENAIKIMEIKKEMFSLQIEAEKARMEKDKTTWFSGIKWVDALKTSIPTAFGIVGILVVIRALFGNNAYDLDMQSIVNSVLLYFLSSFSSYKCFKN
jgi:hypothetical protein